MTRELFDKNTQAAAVMNVFQLMLTNCRDITEDLETSLSDWAIRVDGQMPVPSEELQKLDYLRQVQADLASVAAHMSEAISCDNSSKGERFETLLSVAKLGETKGNLYRAMSIEDSGTSLPSAETSHSGDVDLFA